MAAFEYIALDETGRKKKGVLEADSPRQIRQQLRDKGWFVQSVVVSDKQKSKSHSFSFLTPRLTTADLALVTRQLSTLIGSSMPLEECLRAVADQSEKTKIRSLMLSVRSKVLEGFSLASALKEYPRAFPVLFQASVHAGEQSGHLDQVLNRLADYMEEQQQIRKQVQMASIYPTILMLVSLAIIIFLLNSVVPDIVSTIVANGQALPRSTAFLLASSDWIQKYWLASLLVIGGVYLLFLWFNKVESRRIKTHQLMLKLPLLKRIAIGFNTSRFVSTIAMLSSSGVPLVEAMNIAAQVVSNLDIKQKVSVAAIQVSEGGSLHNALTHAQYFRPMMLHMIASGEASGELDIMLQKTADAEANSVKELIATLLGLFEPLMLVLMGGVVLIIVMAIVTPIMQMNAIGV